MLQEAVSRLHNLENNQHKFNPETGINSPHNQAVITYLLEELKTSFADADSQSIKACCRTYYEPLRRKYTLSLPEKLQIRDSIKVMAKIRQRKRRVSVLVVCFAVAGVQVQGHSNRCRERTVADSNTGTHVWWGGCHCWWKAGVGC